MITLSFELHENGDVYDKNGKKIGVCGVYPDSKLIDTVAITDTLPHTVRLGVYQALEHRYLTRTNFNVIFDDKYIGEIGHLA